MKNIKRPSQKSIKAKLLILDNAVSEFAKNGLKGASVNKIANSAGLSKKKQSESKLNIFDLFDKKGKSISLR